jgi:hypothetical protein
MQYGYNMVGLVMSVQALVLVQLEIVSRQVLLVRM